MTDSSRFAQGSSEESLGPVAKAAALIDADGVVLGWTAAAEQLLGFRAQEVVGRTGAMLLADGETAGERGVWAAHAAARRPRSGPVTVRTRDGTERQLSLEASPLSGGGRTDWLVSVSEPGMASAWAPAEGTVSAALMARSPIGLSIWDTDLRCIWLNDAAERQDGLLRRERLGRLMTEVQPGDTGRALTSAMRDVLATGEPVIEREYTWQVPGEDETRVLSASYFRLDGADGRPIGVVNMATDIDKSRARQHLLLLGEAGNRIGTTLDLTTTAQELADAVVPLLADYATVDLAEPVQLGDEPPQRLPAEDFRIPVFRRAGMASVHEGAPEALWQPGEVVYVPPASPFTRVLSSGRSYFEPILRTGPGTWLEKDPERSRAIAATGIHTLIIVPLQARGTLLGEAVFVRTDNKTPFSRDDLLLLEELTGRAALSLDNARRYTRERAASIALQRNLLPHHLSGGRAVDIASRYLPADTHEGVGGDWFDVIPLPRAQVGLVVGDVVGHGINAAALMGQLRTVMRTLADRDLSPAELLAGLDRLVPLTAEQEDGPDGVNGPVMSCTCVYAVYDPVTRRCTMASAGHPPPAVVDPDGRVDFPEVPSGTPIGLGRMDYESITMTLPAGSVIVLYTDGLIETRTADLDAGLGRLRSALARPADSLERQCAQVIDAMVPYVRRAPTVLPRGVRKSGSSEDDIALLMARTRVLPAGDGGAREHQ
ncbi:SpoIIE family protein phosphatase [Streptomyces sp. TS71-3]|uniref:SpoIIE family protein phosphatase n=1 Tax=Streptomyces sp. TS71-3 TaxID=2733862 RepID=UPI001BB39E43|nr:SpoIIE family protein phosphatase [Streptomyces sp. TS71-3]